MVFVLWLLFGFAVLLLLFAGYLWLIAPARRPYPRQFRRDILYAHRGLHDGNQTVFENSMAAFRLAVEHGYGMEMDLQSTRDGQVVVHHDLNTLRVCGVDTVIEQTDYEDLPPLPDGTPIPLFSEFLALVDGKVPVIIELKYHKQYLRTVRATLELLQGYDGDYCLESFHPSIVRYLRIHAPGELRGQLSAGSFDPGTHPAAVFVLKHLLINVLSRPHFIAYGFKHDRTPSLRLIRKLFRPLLVTWTVRSQQELDAARERYDAVMFEGFIPDFTPETDSSERR
ncbi:MAG TPA: glycerophosphodiester phosphodiesterase family protein [Candidatus Limiplasma sp.]|nr:glycerophosphodiester phosphodiesterase family protein [Candidatus Limiplasma sp.]HRX08848.1 glycerophosphodiester phosphodiesterase family protein [Candidatus Limiplasma sp.]